MSSSLWAGAAVAVARYALAGWVEQLTDGRLPWGTFVVNVSGSFLLGIVFALAIDRALLAPELRVPLMVGFIGSYTTFSTLMLESTCRGGCAALRAGQPAGLGGGGHDRRRGRPRHRAGAGVSDLGSFQVREVR